MTRQGITELLTDYAEEAKYYDVTAQALSAAKRRRKARRLYPAASGVIAGALLATWIALAPSSSTPDVLPAAAVAGCPSDVLPQPDAIALPSDRAVGRSCLVHHQRAANAEFLVAGDGSQYRLPPLVSGPGVAGHGLSPSGEWLAIGDLSGSTTVRDLLTTKTVLVDGAPLAWSADSRWLAVGPLPTEDNPGQITLLESTTGDRRTVDLSAFARTRLIAVLPSGEPVLVPLDVSGNVQLIIVDPATGELKRRLQVDVLSFLLGVEPSPVGVSDFVFTADGRMLVRPTYQLGSLHVPGDVIVVDLESATVVTRWKLPTPTANETWESLRLASEGLLLKHRTPTKSLSIELYDPATGVLSLVTDLSAVGST